MDHKEWSINNKSLIGKKEIMCLVILYRCLFVFSFFLWTKSTDTPVLNSGDVSSGYVALFALGRGINVMHSLRFTSGVTPAEPLSSHECVTGRARLIRTRLIRSST